MSKQTETRSYANSVVLEKLVQEQPKKTVEESLQLQIKDGPL